MADIKFLLVEDDENLAYMEKSCFEDIIEGYEGKTAGTSVWICPARCCLASSNACILAAS